RHPWGRARRRLGTAGAGPCRLRSLVALVGCWGRMVGAVRPRCMRGVTLLGRPQAQGARCAPARRRARAPRLVHVAALDGLRGLAVAGVLAFHTGFAWASGGFLGVSTFFTLSGFLITSLLLAEWQATGQVHLAAFWARRVRRLMPAALLPLGGIAVFGAVVADAEQL